MDIELAGTVDVIVSEWLGGFGIDEGMLRPGHRRPRPVAQAGRGHDPRLGHRMDRPRARPVPRARRWTSCGTTRTASTSGLWSRRRSTRSPTPAPSATSRRPTAAREPGLLWTTDADTIPLEQARAPHEAEVAARGPRPRDGQRAGSLVQRGARARRLAVHRSRRPADALGDDDGPAALARRAHARHGRPGQGPDGSGAADGDVDALGHRDARWRLGGARRAVGLGGDRRLRGGWPPAVLSGATVRRRASPA